MRDEQSHQCLFVAYLLLTIVIARDLFSPVPATGEEFSFLRFTSKLFKFRYELTKNQVQVDQIYQKALQRGSYRIAYVLNLQAHTKSGEVFLTQNQ